MKVKQVIKLLELDGWYLRERKVVIVSSRAFLIMFLRLLYVLLLGCSVCGLAEAKTWRVFSPPNKRLSIELPTSPKPLTREDEQFPTIFPRTKTAFFYTADLKPGGQPELFFGVIDLSKRLNNRRFDDIVNSNVLWISGDDKHFSKEADVTVSGLHGRDFVYNKGVMSGRALFLNGANRVYILIYSTESNAVAADTVNRIFSSFRPLRR